MKAIQGRQLFVNKKGSCFYCWPEDGDLNGPNTNIGHWLDRDDDDDDEFVLLNEFIYLLSLGSSLAYVIALDIKTTWAVEYSALNKWSNTVTNTWSLVWAQF